VASSGGVVLFDTGMHSDGSFDVLERGLAESGLGVEDVRLVACTHAHGDHYGQASQIVRRAGCELWMHANHHHTTRDLAEPDAALACRRRVARASGVPDDLLERYAANRRDWDGGVAEIIRPHRELRQGTLIETDLGAWETHETPGHCPSHVCFFQPELGLLIGGDHLLERAALYFEYGWSEDPIAEFQRSLDVVDALDAQTCLPGHGDTFSGINARVSDARRRLQWALERTLDAVSETEATAFEIATVLYRGALTVDNGFGLMSSLLCYLRHLELLGQLECSHGRHERWRAR
jgi:glyoxylase-like metal-dependent hydrolase (beta-lactamase superfamily II)